MDNFTALEKIDELGELKDDWDYQGGAAISKTAVIQARYLVELYPAPNFIAPTPGGEIGMYWGPKEMPEKLAVYCGMDGYSFLYCPTKDDTTWIEKENVLPEEIAELIKRAESEGEV